MAMRGNRVCSEPEAHHLVLSNQGEGLTWFHWRVRRMWGGEVRVTWRDDPAGPLHLEKRAALTVLREQTEKTISVSSYVISS